MKKIFEEKIKELKKICEELAKNIDASEFYVHYKKFPNETIVFKIVAPPDLFIVMEGNHVTIRKGMWTRAFELQNDY